MVTHASDFQIEYERSWRAGYRETGLSGSEGAGRRPTTARPHGAALPPYATQLINAGCRVTTIQKFLGHERLNSTMVYARVHDRTVAADYYIAMAQIEQRLALAGAPPDEDTPLPGAARVQLLDLVQELAAPEIDAPARLALVERMQRMLREDTAAAPSA